MEARIDPISGELCKKIENTDLDSNFKFSGTAEIFKFKDSSTNLYFRICIRNSQFSIDKELTATGFDGTESVDWENVTAFS